MNNFTYHLMLFLELITFRITLREYSFRRHWQMDPKLPASHFWEVVVDDPEQSKVYDGEKKATIKVKIVPTRGVGGSATRLITDNREQAMNLKAIIEHDAKQLRAFECNHKWVANEPQDPMLWDSIKMREDPKKAQSDVRYAKDDDEVYPSEM